MQCLCCYPLCRRQWSVKRSLPPHLKSLTSVMLFRSEGKCLDRASIIWKKMVSDVAHFDIMAPSYGSCVVRDIRAVAMVMEWMIRLATSWHQSLLNSSGSVDAGINETRSGRFFHYLASCMDTACTISHRYFLIVVYCVTVQEASWKLLRKM